MGKFLSGLAILLLCGCGFLLWSAQPTVTDSAQPTAADLAAADLARSKAADGMIDILIQHSALTLRACEGAFDGNAEEQLNLALSYAMYGMGLKVNRTRAYAWALIAEENGAGDAPSIRSQLAGKLQEADFRQAWDWKRAIDPRIADPAMTAKKKCSMELAEHGS